MPANAGGADLIPGLGGSLGEGNGKSLQYFFYYYYFKVEDNYSIVLVSVIHQHESALGLHMPPPTSLPAPPR